jgi:hypothetical protein
MLMQQCSFKKGNTYTQCWVDAKKVNNATHVTFKDLGNDNDVWEVLYKGTIKDKSDIEITFKNNHTRKFGNKS